MACCSLVILMALFGTVATPTSAAAQTVREGQQQPAPAGTVPPASGPETAAPSSQGDTASPAGRRGNQIIRIGSPVTVAAGDVARQVTVILGNATIAGRVSHDVVVILGHAEIAATARIDGDFVAVGGSATIAEGARLEHDLVVVAGTLETPPSFAPGGDVVVVGSQSPDSQFSGLFRWVSSGLLWGRPIVPGMAPVWLVVATFFLVYLVLGLLFERPVHEIAGALAARPFTTFVVGFFIVLLLGPVCLLLAVSVVGIAVIPLVLVALFAAAILGKIGVARWIGRSIVGTAEDPRADAVRSFAVGFGVITLAYVVPLLGIVAWTLLSVLAVGASALSFVAAYQRETPMFERIRRAAPAPPVDAGFVPAAAMAGGGGVVFDAVPERPVVQETFAHGLLSYPRASLGDRLLSGLLDLILLLLILGFLAIDNDWWFTLGLVYFIGFWSWKGTTVGGIICQLRIARVDSQPLRFVDGLVRGLSAIFSLAVAGLGFFWIAKDPERQAWHDRIAGTYVVKVPRHYPL